MTNPNDPVELLLDEHVVILAQADELRQAMDRLAKAGPSGLEAERETLGSFARLLAGKLALHALKEDDALFPAVEAHIGTDGPTAVMREEHKEIHQRGVEYRALLKELHEVGTRCRPM
jgi:hemerythrin-like domain-containing protein